MPQGIIHAPPFRNAFLVLILAIGTISAPCALSIPTRPTSFPLSRPTVAGEVVAWGSNFWGQAIVPTNLTNVVAIAAGWHHSLAIRRDGSVVAWGENNNGQCSVPTDLSDVVSVAGGLSHSLALLSDGRVIAWGINDQRIVVPESLTNAVAIAASDTASYALRIDGAVIRWGLDKPFLGMTMTNIVAIRGIRSSVLMLKGDGSIIDGEAPSLTPYEFRYVRDIAAIGSGIPVYAALRTDGAVAMTGDPSYSLVPGGLKAIQVASAGASYAAVREDSSVAAWGVGYLMTNVPPRLRGVIGLEGGLYHYLAIKRPTPPIPTTAVANAEINNGSIIRLNIIDGGEGYTEPPTITITGGNGSGAIATAQISRGVVTGLTLINAGANYTTPPTVTFSSPPILPALGIAPSRVNVTMQVIPGKQYQLESSTNLWDFSPLGLPFRAQADTVTNEFILQETGQFFRIQELP